MPEFDLSTLAFTDDVDDQERASDGYSRYGVYLTYNADQLHGHGDPLTPAEFATAAWHIATSPIMSPGYVRTRPDLHHLAPDRDEEGNLLMRITVPLRHRHLVHQPAPRTADWDTVNQPWTNSAWSILAEPERTERPTVLAGATLLLPVPIALLPHPTAVRPGAAMTEQAKQAVQTVVHHANDHAHLVNDLTGSAR